MSDPGLGLLGGALDPSGAPLVDLSIVEDRRIILAQGLESHAEDLTGEGPWGPWESWRLFDFLQNGFRSSGRTVVQGLTGFNRTSETEADYLSAAQGVHYFITIVKSKQALKTAMQTPGVHVIYDGHARYGRGAGLSPYSGTAPTGGEMWENGSGPDDGIFRMGYPYVPVSMVDMEQRRAVDDGHNDHRKGFYTFRPLSADGPAPPMDERHPDARHSLRRMILPAELRPHVAAGFESATHSYWGSNPGGRDPTLLLHADWTGSQSQPFDLGATTLACKVFCHFGCSSRKHFWEIVRRPAYKGWVRDNPPTDRFAYFTTNPSDPKVTPLWLHALFSYNVRNNWLSWFPSLEHAKARANLKFSQAAFRDTYRVY